jgi:hypothetical protein
MDERKQKFLKDLIPSEAFIADLLADYQKHGAHAIDRMRKEDPTAYIRMIASVVSKQVDKAPNPLEHFTN